MDATQTPAGLSKKDGGDYSRTDFYLEQVLDCLKYLPLVVYYVADGLYAKVKIVNGLSGAGKHLITRLRTDANLKYINTSPRQKGASRKYDGKVTFTDLSKWELVGQDEKNLHLGMIKK